MTTQIDPNRADKDGRISPYTATPTAGTNQAATSVVPQELVSRISWDYNQLVIGFVCKKLDELAAKLTDGDVAVGRRRAFIDVLDYLESVPRLHKQYRVDVVSQVQVTDLATGGSDDK